MHIKWKLLALLISVLGTSNMYVFADEPKETPANTEATTRDAWQKKIAAINSPEPGCYHVKYPSTTLEKIPCKSAPKQPFSLPPKGKGSSKASSSFSDYYLRAPKSALLARIMGSFPAVTGVKTIATEGGGTVDGPNLYSLQISSNFAPTTACKGISGCSVWQQFVYSTQFPGQGSGPAILMEFWLFGYSSPCPQNWGDYGNGTCMLNVYTNSVPLIPITDLSKVELWGSAIKSGQDEIRLKYGDEVFFISADDSTLYLSEVWKDAEFNVFGNGGGSEAVFNAGSSVTVKVESLYNNVQLSLNPPECIKGNITGETNNLTNLSQCIASPYGPAAQYPYIQFTQSN